MALRSSTLLLSARVGHPKGERSAGLTQYEVAEALGISRARVSQLEQRALRKLRLGLVMAGVDGPAAEPVGFPDEGDADE